MHTKLERAVIDLKANLFGRSSDLGFIGLAEPDTIHVYVHGSKRMWRDLAVEQWQTFKVVWHYKVGPIVAGLQP